jgi:hypothetical protein
LAEQTLDAIAIAFDVGVDFRIRSFEISVRDNAGAAIAGADDMDHIRVMPLDDAVEVIGGEPVWRTSIR